MCSSGWDMTDAEVVCRQLGCGSAVRAPQWAHFGEGSGRIWMDETACRGAESALSDCSHRGWGVHNCGHYADAGVICSGHVEARLVGGPGTCVGRVEMKHGDTWESICDSHFDLQAASVVCSQLHCGTAVSTPGGARFGEGQGPIWTEEFQCVGNESHLVYCPKTLYGDQSCTHGNDVGVICSSDSESLRLLNGKSRCDGRVEISLGGVWRRVLDDQWDINDANVVCRQLQCGDAERAYNPVKSERRTGLVGLRRVQCAGNESHLTHCNTSLSETVQAGIAEDVGVVCSEFMDLRLVNGGDCAGRLEIFYNGSWESICSNQMTSVTATIVCKQLGCGDEGDIAEDFTYGAGSGHTWLDHVRCLEHHNSLWQCPSKPWSPLSCANRAEETHIMCTDNTEATASPERTEPPQRPSPTAGRDMVPVVICIVLGALLCLVLIVLGGQMRSTRALCRASGTYSGPLTDPVYEEIDYYLMREKLETFSRSVSYSEDSVMKLQYYTGDSEDGRGPGSAQEETSPGDFQQDYDSVEEPEQSDSPVPPDGKEALALAGGVAEDGYDEAGEVPDLAHFPDSGLTGVPAERDKNAQTCRDSQTVFRTEHVLG